ALPAARAGSWSVRSLWYPAPTVKEVGVGMLGNAIRRFATAALALTVLVSALGITPPVAMAAAGFNPSRIVDDSVFTNIDKLSVAEYQAHLASKGSRLNEYSENRRTAAQRIWGAAHGHGDAPRECNNTRFC